MFTNDVPGALNENRDLILKFCWMLAQHVQAQLSRTWNLGAQRSLHIGGAIVVCNCSILLEELTLRDALDGAGFGAAFEVIIDFGHIKSWGNLASRCSAA